MIDSALPVTTKNNKVRETGDSDTSSPGYTSHPAEVTMADNPVAAAFYELS